MEFRVLIRVNKDQPEIAVKSLGYKVVGDVNAFSEVDLDFIRKQDFITAVPIEIALTLKDRVEMLYSHPNLKFVVTGVPVQRVPRLYELGYTAYAPFTEEDFVRLIATRDMPEEVVPEVEKDSPVVEEKNDGDENVGDENLPNTEVDNTTSVEKKYYVNGKEVDKKQYKDAAKEFEDDIKELSKECEHLFGFFDF